MEMNEKAPPGWSGTVAAMRIKHGGEIDNPYALAWSMKNKGDKPHYKETKSSKVKTVPPKKRESHMKFKEFLHDVEGLGFNEGPRGRKVGEFLGGLAGLAGPALGGAAISGEMMGGDMFDKHGAPGGLIGTGLGIMKGRNWGQAIGGAIGDKIGDGLGWVGKKMFGKKKPKSTGTPYFDALTGGRDVGDPNAVTFKAGDRREEKGTVDKDYFANREKMDAAGKTLAFILNDKLLDFGYSPNEVQQFVTNVGESNRVLRAWLLHYHQMVEDAIKAGHPGTAKMMGKRGVELLQEKGVLPPPATRTGTVAEPEEPAHDLGPDDFHHEEPDDVPAPDVEQPTAHHKRTDLFGDEIPEPKPKRKRAPADPSKPKRKRPSRAKKKPETPGLFD